MTKTLTAFRTRHHTTNKPIIQNQQKNIEDRLTSQRACLLLYKNIMNFYLANKIYCFIYIGKLRNLHLVAMPTITGHIDIYLIDDAKIERNEDSRNTQK